MPINAQQLAAGANYTLNTYAANDPIDQFTMERPFSDWLIANKAESSFGNGIYNEKVRITNDSNYQNYTRDDTVSYNRKDTVRMAPFQHYEAHDGFSLNETDLSDNGIILTDDRNAVATDAESIQIVNKLTEGWSTLKDGFQENWDKEVHLDGTQSALAVPGLDALVSVDGTGVIGGIDASVTANGYWKNNFNTGISTGTAGTLIAAMEVEWRKCVTHGKMGSPDFIVVGSKFLDAYAKDVRAQTGTTFMVTTPAKGGVALDGSRTGVFFKGVELVWDPTFDALQAALNPTINWDKRCYFLNKKVMKLRPNRGRWMVKRTPPRVYDRYTYYFGMTADYGLTVKQRNAQSVLSIA
jgi:hypothetical protein